MLTYYIERDRVQGRIVARVEASYKEVQGVLYIDCQSILDGRDI